MIRRVAVVVLGMITLALIVAELVIMALPRTMAISDRRRSRRNDRRKHARIRDANPAPWLFFPVNIAIFAAIILDMVLKPF
jgi:hypothetical protein